MNLKVLAPVYVLHVTLTPEREHPDGNAHADPVSTTPHNTATPTATANNTATRPRARANDKPSRRTPLNTIPNTSGIARRPRPSR